MNSLQLEALLVAARPAVRVGHSAFTQTVMDELRRRALLERGLQKVPQQGWLGRLKRAHGVSLFALVAGGIILLGGVVYASVQFAPDLIHIFKDKVNGRGQLEYKAPGFAACQDDNTAQLQAFAVRPDAGLSDAEVQKALQAKCELMSIDKFASGTWPTYGQHQPWRDGDNIYYTRPDIIGTVQTINEHEVVVMFGGGVPGEKTYKTFERRPLEAYSRGRRIPRKEVKPGDLVFTITRVSEQYHSGPHQASPRDLGIVAVVKLSLPARYYFDLQRYITDVTTCAGNPQEECVTGSVTSIDVFPRQGGEGATNPALRPAAKNLKGLSIDGVVTLIEPHSFTIKASSGALYTVGLDKLVLDNYNNNYAPAYDTSTNDPAQVRIHVGSWLNILYEQTPNDNPKTIATPDILRISLLLPNRDNPKGR